MFVETECSHSCSNCFLDRIFAHVTCIFHHYLTLFDWHYIVCKDRRKIEAAITTLYFGYTNEFHTFTSRAQKQHIASIVFITFSYHVCFPFDALIHNLIKETVQLSLHLEFVQHRIDLQRSSAASPVLYNSLLHCS